MKPKKDDEPYQPLATRLRPRQLCDLIGQTHLLGHGKPLRRAIDQGILHSMIFWGPPGTGKTTLAQLLANSTAARFVRLPAINAGVKEIREVVELAKETRQTTKQATILFIDEIHRFNKAQQDAFLPYVEEGTVILIGATTENPSFELNNALLSRARVYVLKRLSDAELLQVIERALSDTQHGLGDYHIDFDETLRLTLAQAADGDARQVLNLLEIIADFADVADKKITVTKALLAEVLQVNLRRFDKQGEAFYDQISALHKSVRGSAPDAALYWYARMIDGGCDPRYIARRLVRMANEDIGLADPRALQMALQAAEVYERLGSPEGELALAQAIVFLAAAPKSNAVYLAYQAALQAARSSGSLPVPPHLCNAPTKLMSQLGYGKDYRYAHEETDGYAAGENYFPHGLQIQPFYQPTARGLEAKIGERLTYLRHLDQAALAKKNPKSDCTDNYD